MIAQKQTSPVRNGNIIFLARVMLNILERKTSIYVGSLFAIYALLSSTLQE